MKAFCFHRVKTGVSCFTEEQFWHPSLPTPNPGGTASTTSERGWKRVSQMYWSVVFCGVLFVRKATGNQIASLFFLDKEAKQQT